MPELRSIRSGRTGLTSIETLIALALFSLLIIAVWNVFGALFAREGPISLFAGTSRSVVLQQSRNAVRKLFCRIQEGVQIEAPPPGTTARELVFRDIKNRRVRVRHLADQRRLVTERLVNGVYVREQLLAHELDKFRGIEVGFCESALFTALTPAMVVVSFTSFDDTVRETFMTVISLANVRLDR